MCDNRILNINGKSAEQLAKALAVAFSTEYDDSTTCVAWRETEKHGLILMSYCSSDNKPAAHRFPTELTAEQVHPVVWQWLHGNFAKTVVCEGWDADADHDGDNYVGWRLYVEDWGHVDGQWGTICAIKPAYLWYGK